MARSCVNTEPQDTGEHEVHNLDTCRHLPHPTNRHDLGNHTTGHTAITAAKKTYRNVDGCAHCSPTCHRK